VPQHLPRSVKKRRTHFSCLLSSRYNLKYCLRAVFTALLVVCLQSVATAQSTDAPKSLLASVRYNGAWGYINASADVKLPFEYNYAQSFRHWAVVRQAGQPLFQIIADDGSALSKTGYEEVRWTDGKFFAIKTGGNWGILNSQGALVVPAKFSDLYASGNELFSFVKNGKWGLINAEGLVVAPSVYDQPIWLTGGIAAASRSGQWGLIDTQGEELGSFDHQFVGSPSGGYAVFKPKDSKLYGFLKSDGSVAIAPAYEAARSFHENLAAVSKGGKWGYVDRFGFWFVQPQYDEALDFRNGYAAVRQGTQWGFINNNGEMAIAPYYEAVGVISEDEVYFSDGLQPAKLNGRWGFIDTKGQVVVQFLYHMVQPYSQGLAAVQLNGRWGYIDTKGKLVIPPIYESATPFVAVGTKN